MSRPSDEIRICFFLCAKLVFTNLMMFDSTVITTFLTLTLLSGCKILLYPTTHSLLLYTYSHCCQPCDVTLISFGLKKTETCF